MLDRLIADTLQELSGYSELDHDVMRAGFDAQLGMILARARSPRAPTGDELAQLAQIGESRAHQGVPIESMLRAWRLGIQIVIEVVSEIADAEQIDAVVALAFTREVLNFTDAAMLATATAHRRAELELVRRDQDRRDAFLRSLLAGTIPLAEINREAAAFGLNPHRTYHAFRARPTAPKDVQALEQALGLQSAVAHPVGLRTTLDGDIVGLLRERPGGADLPGTVGVGPALGLDRLSTSFALATRAALCGARFALTGAYSIEDLGLRPAISEDDAVGDALVRRYLEPLGPGSNAVEIVATVRTYLHCSMNVERTAEQLFVHGNTVRYRIARFEEQSGASLRDSLTAFEVWWALERAALSLRTLHDFTARPETRTSHRGETS